MASGNPLEVFFRKNTGRQIHKWIHYFDIYDRHFAPYRKKPITVMEFGVQHGGSLAMWRDYFGKKARIIGVDVDPRCADVGADSGAEVIIGDQEDRDFLATLRDKYGPVDVIIEDGGHTMAQQIATFEVMWPAVAQGGVMLVEDLHTSYWPDYGGGHLEPASFIEYAKRLIDAQHAWHSNDPEHFGPDEYTMTLRGMHVYDSVIVFDKAPVSRPHHEMTGVPSFEDLDERG